MKRSGRVAATAAACAAGAALLGLADRASAQTPNLPRSQAEFEQQIGLTPDQKTKIQAIQKKYQPQIQAVQGKYKPQADALNKQMQALQAKMRDLSLKAFNEAKPTLDKQQKEVDAVLTPTQRTKIKALQAQQQQMIQQMQQGQMGGMPAAGGAPKR